jgi:nucleotide-binding universal stress UspA family protein
MKDRVLVPVNDSPPAWAALNYAVSHPPKQQLICLHAINPAPYISDINGVGGPLMLEQKRTAATDLMETITSKISLDSCEFQTEIQEGRPKSVIIEYAETHAIDEIVIGTHGRTGVTRLLIGSVTEAVLRESPVPVTVIPPSDSLLTHP